MKNKYQTIKDVNNEFNLPANALYNFLNNTNLIHKNLYIQNGIKKTQYRLTNNSNAKKILDEIKVYQTDEVTQYRVIVTNKTKLINLYNQYRTELKQWTALWAKSNLDNLTTEG